MKLILLIAVLLIPFTANSKTILVTCATGSIGSKVVEVLQNEGHKIIPTGRNPDKLKLIGVNGVELDFSNIKSIEAAATKVGEVDGVVLIGPRPSLGKNPTVEDWNKAFNDTFINPLELINKIKIKDGGSIVIISGNTSKSYFSQYPNTNVIRVAWSAEIKNLVHSMKDRKVRINGISPGPLMTDHHIEKIKKVADDKNITYKAELDSRVKSIPANKYGEVDDVAHLVSFLLSDKSVHINGTNIAVDGGENLAYD